MEDIVIKYKKASYERDEDILRLCRYIAGECDSKKEVTRYCCGAGVSTDPNKAARQMIKLQKLYRKEVQRHGKNTCRRIYHYIVSFSQSMADANSVKMAAMDIAEIFSGQYQVYYGIHEDTKDLHVHYAINAVSYVDGKKWHKNRREIQEMEMQIREKGKAAWLY